MADGVLQSESHGEKDSDWLVEGADVEPYAHLLPVGALSQHVPN